MIHSYVSLDVKRLGCFGEEVCSVLGEGHFSFGGGDQSISLVELFTEWLEVGVGEVLVDFVAQWDWYTLSIQFRRGQFGFDVGEGFDELVHSFHLFYGCDVGGDDIQEQIVDLLKLFGEVQFQLRSVQQLRQEEDSLV